MPYILYDYVNPNGENEIKSWAEGLQKIQRAKFNEKLDKLKQHGDDLHPHMLTDTGTPGIKKLRIKGNVQLRPLLCNGPINIDKEYTLLMGAKEIGGKWVPKEAPSIANSKKQIAIADPNTRRKTHERIT